MPAARPVVPLCGPLACVGVPIAWAGDGQASSGRGKVGARRRCVAIVLACAATTAVFLGLDGTPLEARIAMLTFAVALIGWSVLRLDDTPVALAACLLLLATGVVPASDLYASLGQELIWLLIAAFVLAATLQASGLAERAALRIVAGAGSVASLFHRLNGAIVVTAFIIPSTSARAALMVPVFVVLAKGLATPRLVRALALLFPTSILLSAGASLIGAGAHLVAIQFIEREAGLAIGFVRWAMLGLPLTLAATVLATQLILVRFVTDEERRLAPSLPAADPRPLSREQRAITAITLGTVLLWCVGPALGVDPAIAALIGALLVTSPTLTGVRLATALKAIEWNLLLFLAATLVLGNALLASGAAASLATAALSLLPLHQAAPWLLLLAAAVSAVGLHLIVPSRTARAVVLLPTVVVPLATAGADLTILALICVQGSGFCQTFTVSAKPLAIFERALGTPGFTPAELLRLALWLGPLMIALLTLFGLAVWPSYGWFDPPLLE